MAGLEQCGAGGGSGREGGGQECLRLGEADGGGVRAGGGCTRREVGQTVGEGVCGAERCGTRGAREKGLAWGAGSVGVGGKAVANCGGSREG